MKYLINGDVDEAMRWINQAAEAAKQAMCSNAKCGTVIVKEGKVIGRGYNAPPLDKEENRTCNQTFGPGKPNFDRTCCMHAEWRAIIDALKNNGDKIKGAKLYFSRVDQNGGMKRAKSIHCTVCSRLALDTGIAEFVLWFEDGIRSYTTDEYDKVSYQYVEKKI
ncbi:MAG: hypothetical protein HY226_01155 [Candidatus Vogelbacteria bacterium]|nr:hypothetical protein [Candidatus Vogelbacteria bacterium]